MITNIPSSDDTRAYRNDPTRNYGTEAETSIWTYNGTQYQVSFAKFAGISGIGSPNILPNSTINSAILWMRIRADSTSLTVSVYTCSADWNESTLIWNNMPGQATSIGSFANMPAGTGGWLSLDITSTVQGWNNGTIPNYGLRLVTDQGGSNSGAFATKESANVPYIAVNYVTPANITATGMTVTPNENPCRTGICTMTVNITWTNNGESTGSFTPAITVSSGTVTPVYSSEQLTASTPVTRTFTVSNMTVGTCSICPNPN